MPLLSFGPGIGINDVWLQNDSSGNTPSFKVHYHKNGFYYPATLTLGQKEILVAGKRLRLSPGMNVTAEIKTGQRRVIESLLSPLVKAGSESLRER